MTEILPDLLCNGLALVFCGTAPSPASAAARAYYANPGNQFWRVLFAVGITPRLFNPGEFRALPGFGVGFTDVAKSVAAVDRDLRRSDFDAAALCRKIARYQPAILAFTSKAACRAAFGKTAGSRIDFGAQNCHIGATRIFVLPSPSGAARASWDIAPWHELAAAYRLTRGAQRFDQAKPFPH